MYSSLTATLLTVAKHGNIKHPLADWIKKTVCAHVWDMGGPGGHCA